MDGPTKQRRDSSSFNDGRSSEGTRFVILQKNGRTRQIRGPLSFATSYACIKRVFFVFRRAPRASFFSDEKIGGVALLLLVSFSAPNKMI